MKSNEPKKHHFIPIFYQKGFLSEDGGLFAYKKKYGGIRDWSPSQILYKENLHTVSIGNEKTTMIEKFLSQIEGQFRKYLSIIEENINNPEITSLLEKDADFQQVSKLMISMQFWRTPCRKPLAIKYSVDLVSHFDNADVEIKEILGNDRRLIKFLQRRASKDDSIKIIQFLLLPLLTFDLSKRQSNLKLLRANGVEKFITSDRPVVFDDLDNLFNYKSFVFPFSQDLLLAGTEKNIRNVDVKRINILIAKRAQEVVISGSRTQLEEIKCNITSK